MPVARKCDRCGTFYEPINNSNYNAFRFAKLHRNQTYENSGEVFDLCPSCIKDLETFIDDYDPVKEKKGE